MTLEEKLTDRTNIGSTIDLSQSCLSKEEQEDKPMIEKEMQRMVHLGILKKEISPYFSPTMLNDRKIPVGKESLLISDFWTVDNKE